MAMLLWNLEYPTNQAVEYGHVVNWVSQNSQFICLFNGFTRKQINGNNQTLFQLVSVSQNIMKCTYVNWKSRNAIEMPVGLNRKNLVHYEMFSESTLKNNDLSPSLCKNTKLVTADGCFSKIKPHKFDAAMVYYLPPKKSEKSLKRILRIKVLEINLRKKKTFRIEQFLKNSA